VQIACRNAKVLSGLKCLWEGARNESRRMAGTRGNSSNSDGAEPQTSPSFFSVETGEDATHASPTFDDKRKQSPASLAQSTRHVTSFHPLVALWTFSIRPRHHPRQLPTTAISHHTPNTNRGPADHTRSTLHDAPCPWPKPLLHQCASSLPRTCTIP
jgi:hypothetical protein